MRYLYSIILLVAAPICSLAQDSAGSDEMIELSPFTVSNDADAGYKAASALAGSRMSSQILDPHTNSFVGAPITIIRRADAVAVQFVLSHAGDKQDIRNKELYSSVEAIEQEIRKVPGLRVEQREVKFAGGDKKVFSSMRGGSPVSFASLVIFADLPLEVRVVDRVKQIRDILSATKLAGQTKAADGSVGLYVKNPDQYRREILQKVVDDFEILKKAFGTEFEIMPNGLNQKVRSRVSGEGEVELWIDYSFTFYSIRALTNPPAKP